MRFRIDISSSKQYDHPFIRSFMYFFKLPAAAGVGAPNENEKPGFAIFQ